VDVDLELQEVAFKLIACIVKEIIGFPLDVLDNRVEIPHHLLETLHVRVLQGAIVNVRLDTCTLVEIKIH
jgi:hypothetical protein